MEELDEIIKKASEWVQKQTGRAIVISAYNYKEDEVTGRVNPDNSVFVKGQKADINAALSHLQKTFR